MHTFTSFLVNLPKQESDLELVYFQSVDHQMLPLKDEMKHRVCVSE